MEKCGFANGGLPSLHSPCDHCIVSLGAQEAGMFICTFLYVYRVVVNRFSVVGPVEPGGSRVREIFFVVSLTLSLLGSMSIFFSSFESVFHSIYVLVNTIKKR